MTSRADFAFVQARIQSRYGQRPGRAEWARLEGAISPSRYLDLARQTALQPWASLLNCAMDHHRMEGVLRAAWRASVIEVAAWLPDAWRAACEVFAERADLAVRDHIARGGSAPCGLDDPFLASAITSPQESSRPREGAGADPAAHWQSVLPRVSAHHAAALNEIVRLLFGTAGKIGTTRHEPSCHRPSAAELEPLFARHFRRHAGGPVAVFAFVSLIWLDFERFRGGLVERAIFGAWGEGGT